MKILLVDDHKMMRDGLRAILEKEDLQIVGEAATGLEAVGLARRLRPDVVVMDISMPDLNGIDATRRLVAEVRGIKVIGLSMKLRSALRVTNALSVDQSRRTIINHHRRIFCESRDQKH